MYSFLNNKMDELMLKNRSYAFNLSLLIQSENDNIFRTINDCVGMCFNKTTRIDSNDNLETLFLKNVFDAVIVEDIESIQSIRDICKNIEIIYLCDRADTQKILSLPTLDIDDVVYFEIEKSEITNSFKKLINRIIMKKENQEFHNKLDIRYSDRVQKIIHHSDKQGMQLKELNKQLSNHKQILENGIKEATDDIIILNKELKSTQFETIEVLGTIAETHSLETSNHIKRVAEYSYLLGGLYGLEPHEMEMLKFASPMHDIGKISIDRDILMKPGSLTKEEFTIVKTHSLAGYNIFKNSKSKILKLAATIAHEHHEKWDGTGYPQGLKGQEIDKFARITAVCDVFDALGFERVYKRAWSNEELYQFFDEQKGKHFDPVLANLLLENIEKFFEIKERYKEN